MASSDLSFLLFVHAQDCPNLKGSSVLTLGVQCSVKQLLRCVNMFTGSEGLY